MHDPDGHAFEGYGVNENTLVLVRPDGYVGMVARAEDTGAVREYLAAVSPP